MDTFGRSCLEKPACGMSMASQLCARPQTSGPLYRGACPSDRQPSSRLAYASELNACMQLPRARSPSVAASQLQLHALERIRSQSATPPPQAAAARSRSVPPPKSQLSAARSGSQPRAHSPAVTASQLQQHALARIRCQSTTPPPRASELAAARARSVPPSRSPSSQAHIPRAVGNV